VDKLQVSINPETFGTQTNILFTDKEVSVSDKKFCFLLAASVSIEANRT
jgi:hypothetical protein